MRRRHPNSQTIRSLDARGLPITRQNWIDTRNLGDPWTEDDEADMPRQLRRDWHLHRE